MEEYSQPTLFDTLAITMPSKSWKLAFELAEHDNREVSDFIRMLIDRTACEVLNGPTRA